MPALDVAGKRFGKCTVLEPIRKLDSLGRMILFWNCLCDCGAKFHAKSHWLVNKETKSCVRCARMTYHHDFWERVSLGDKDECWLWLGATTEAGYGTLTINHKPLGAHRMSWILMNGEIPKGMNVCHKCDIPPCVNPNHLFLGTHQENMDDKVKKGRQPTRFTGSVRAKIKGQQFDMFKSRISAGEKPFSIAKEFGIHGATACKIAKQLFSK